jgi:hypothetical protein
VTTGASGTVNFQVGGATISGCSSQVLNAGFATCTTSSLVSGSNLVMAIYSGDTNFTGSTSSTLSYSISSATLIVPVYNLVVTPTLAPFNQSLTLTTTGGSGTGAISFSVVNGTATSCTVAGSVLTFHTTITGTCLVTATQASDATYLAQSSNVTTITLYTTYPGTYGVVSSYYTCPSGGTLSGSTCTMTSTYAATSGPPYSCPSGGTLSGTTCTTTVNFNQATCIANGLTWVLGVGCVTGTYAASPTYTCPSGGTLSGSTCTITTTYAATLNYNYGYTCPSGGSLSGTICTLSGISPLLRHSHLNQSAAPTNASRKLAKSVRRASTATAISAKSRTFWTQGRSHRGRI